MPEIEVVLTSDADEIEYDLLTTIMSLPLAFRTELETIPAEVPYLRTPAARTARMRHHLGPATGPRVGLAWSGSRASQARSAIPPATLEPLLRRSGIEFHCLQKELRAEDRTWLDRTGLVTTHDAMLRDFADTAALIEAMDLVISIDTAVAHLAGALAKPVWIMLAFNPDWRWMLGREDSPWYPTARLFRQSKPGDWERRGPRRRRRTPVLIAGPTGRATPDVCRGRFLWRGSIAVPRTGAPPSGNLPAGSISHDIAQVSRYGRSADGA